jgi:hypothetical protein
MIRTYNKLFGFSQDNHLTILSKRISLVDTEIQVLCRKMGISHHVSENIQWKINTKSVYTSPAVSRENEILTISLPPLFFLHTEDFHENNAMAKEFFKRTAKLKFSESEIPFLNLFSEFIQDPVLSQKGRLFTLAHEIAHIALGHLDMPRPKNHGESIAREREADLFAGKMIGDAALGGVYIFELMEKHLPNATPTTHPTPSKRKDSLDLCHFLFWQ